VVTEINFFGSFEGLQAVGLLISGFLLTKTIIDYKRRKIGKRGFVLWVVIWAFAVVAFIIPGVPQALFQLLDVEIKNVENPRVELEEHYYKADHEKLRKIGFKPTQHIDDEIGFMLDDLIVHKDRINEKRDAIRKVLKWREGLAAKQLKL